MAVAASTLLGRPVWYELMTSDMKAAEAFYKAVVGWKTEPFEGAGRPYTAFNRSGDVSVGGVMDKPAEVKAPPFWAMYVAVPKLEEAVSKIKRLGGKTHTEVIADTEYRPHADDDGSAGRGVLHHRTGQLRAATETAPEVGEASWHELMTTDAPAAMKFYQEVFGWQPSRGDGHGADGHVPDVQSPARDDRRHDEQAAGDGERAAELADLLPRS